MSTLDGKTIASTFRDLLQVSNNNVGVDNTIRYIEDGEGTRSALALSTSAVELSGNLVPAQDVTFDLGSATHRFKDLYLSGNTIYLGDTTFSTADIQAVKSVQDLGVENLPTFSEVATPAQGAKADSAIQPNDPRNLMPASNMTQDIGSAANHWMNVYTHHLNAHGDVITTGDVIVGGEIHGPEILKIDPAAVGDNTGRVVIAGDLQVDGTTTTVNSTTMTVSGKTITLADGATDATQVDGAGVEVAGSGATISYTSDNDSWNTNKTLIAPTLQSENTVTEQLNVTGNAAIDQMDLTAVEQIKNDQAVAVFIYDTSKDSDGGVWRHRVTHTSWYNEQLNTEIRGSRREFPAVAIVVVEDDKATIYDGDDPDMPMWMVFRGGSSRAIRYQPGTCVSCVNGRLVLGQSLAATETNTAIGGLTIADFIIDHAEHHNDADAQVRMFHGIAERDTGIHDGVYTGSPFVVGHGNIRRTTETNGSVNDVAMTVLPDAPVGPDTGLPVPTIAVATDHGISVIKHDGTVVSKEGAEGSRDLDHIALTDDNHLIASNKNYIIYFDETIGDFTNESGQGYLGNYPTTHSYPRSYTEDLRWEKTGVLGQGPTVNHVTPVACASDDGVTKFDIQANKHDQSMSNFITSTYNTGWMPNDTKLATLCETTSGTIGLDVDEQVVHQDNFDTDVDAWTQVDPASNPNSTFVWLDGRGMGIRATGESFRWSTPITTIPGVEYSVSFGMLSGSNAGYYVANSDDASSGDWQVIANDGAVIQDTNTYNFIATRDTTYIVLNTSTVDSYIHFDDLMVKRTQQQIRNSQFDPNIDWQTDGWRLDEPGTWTMANSSLERVQTVTDDGYRAAQQQLTLTPGQSYEVSFDLKSIFDKGSAWVKINDGHVDTATDTGYYVAQNVATSHLNPGYNMLPGERFTTTFTPTAAQVTVGVVANHVAAYDYELIKNGSFDQSGYEGGSRHWEYGSNWTISGQGAATTNNTNTSGDRSERALIQRGRLIPGQRYKMSFVVDNFTFEGDDLVAFYVAGRLSDLVLGSGGPDNYVVATVSAATTPGSIVTGEFVASTSDLYLFTSASGSVGGIKNITIDNVSVKTTGGSIDNFSVKPTNNMIKHGRFDQADVNDEDFKNLSPSWYGQDPDDDTYVFGRAEIRHRRLRLHNVANLTGRLVQEIDTEIGETYVFSCDGYVGTTEGFQITKTDNKNGDLGDGSNHVTSGIISSDQRASITFVATATKSYVRLATGANNSEHQYSEFDNITLYKAVADRSFHGNGLETHGTLQATPVAPGADVVAYSDFSDNNYLVQPYNSDLDFGTGDFCFIGWIKTDSTGNQKIFTRDADSVNRFQIYSINGGVGLYTQDNGDRSYYISNKIISDGEWHQFCCARRDGVLEVFVDGVKDTGSPHQGTINVPRNITAPGTASRVGNTYTYGIDPWDGAIAMLRVSKIVPTSDQIKRIYNDEKQLFKPGAQATLFGGSDTVTALHVDDHDQIHVGTSEGKSVFRGLTRVDHHDTPINNIIETAGDFTIER